MTRSYSLKNIQIVNTHAPLVEGHAVSKASLLSAMNRHKYENIIDGVAVSNGCDKA